MQSSFDLKHNIAKLKPQNRDDLFLLKETITPGSFITARSPRSIKVKRGDQMVRGASLCTHDTNSKKPAPAVQWVLYSR